MTRGSSVGRLVGITRHSDEVKLLTPMPMYSPLNARPTVTLNRTFGSVSTFTSCALGVPMTWRHTVSPRLAASGVM